MSRRILVAAVKASIPAASLDEHAALYLAVLDRLALLPASEAFVPNTALRGETRAFHLFLTLSGLEPATFGEAGVWAREQQQIYAE
jgi:hypothetical protein